MSINGNAEAELGTVLRLQVAPDARQACLVRKRLLEFAQSRDVDTEQLHDFMTAFGEALANAVEHSHTSTPIDVEIRLVDDGLFATVMDHGCGFAANGSLRSQLPEMYSERGRGFPLMRTCTDVFAIRSAPGVGTSVTIGTHVVSARRVEAAV
jgi:anti-sigma regulatory factor (Ser/Thr protein kinase)